MIISRAAIMFSNGEVVEGHNYGQILTTAHKLSFGGECIHGFTTSSGEFVLPDEASVIAFAADQIKEPTEKLTPEDLWPEYSDI